jgi:hypothetical protein
VYLDLHFFPGAHYRSSKKIFKKKIPREIRKQNIKDLAA